MPKCEQCGRGFCHAKSDIKSGKIRHPELCHYCQEPIKIHKVGFVESIGKTKKNKKDKYFKSEGYEGEKRTDDDEMAELVL